MFWRKQPSPVEENQENGQEKHNGEPMSMTVEEKTPSNDPPPVSFFRLFRFANKSKILSNSDGMVCAIAAGAAQIRIVSAAFSCIS